MNEVFFITDTNGHGLGYGFINGNGLGDWYGVCGSGYGKSSGRGYFFIGETWDAFYE